MQAQCAYVYALQQPTTRLHRRPLQHLPSAHLRTSRCPPTHLPFSDSKTGKVVNEFGATRFDVAVRGEALTRCTVPCSGACWHCSPNSHAQGPVPDLACAPKTFSPPAMRGEFDPPEFMNNTERTSGLLLDSLTQFPAVRGAGPAHAWPCSDVAAGLPAGCPRVLAWCLDTPPARPRALPPMLQHF